MEMNAQRAWNWSFTEKIKEIYELMNGNEFRNGKSPSVGYNFHASYNLYASVITWMGRIFFTTKGFIRYQKNIFHFSYVIILIDADDMRTNFSNSSYDWKVLKCSFKVLT